MSFSGKLHDIQSKNNKNKSIKKSKKMFKLGLSWGSIVLACIAIAIKLTGHPIADALENLLDTTIGALGNGLGGVGDFISGIPLVGGLLSAPFKGCEALSDFIIAILMWLPTVMGNAFDVFFTVGTIVLAINGLSYLAAQYSVEKELMRGNMVPRQFSANTYVESEKVKRGTLELPKTERPIPLEKNENLKELDIDARTKKLSVFAEQRETQ